MGGCNIPQGATKGRVELLESAGGHGSLGATGGMGGPHWAVIGCEGPWGLMGAAVLEIQYFCVLFQLHPDFSQV